MSELSITCSTCNGTGWEPVPDEDRNDRSTVTCPTCKGRELVIPDHVIEAAARKMYAEVGTRKDDTLTYDIAYPDEQADFLRVAKKMLWAGVNAALSTEPANPDIEAAAKLILTQSWQWVSGHTSWEHASDQQREAALIGARQINTALTIKEPAR